MHIGLPPFKILALAPFSPYLETDNPPLITTDPLAVDQALAELNPTLDIPLDPKVYPAASINISISRLADFRPKNIKKQPAFKAICGQLEKESDTVHPIPPAPKSSTALDDILSMVDSGQPQQPAAGSNAEPQINSCLLQTIFTHPAFRKMESAWRGLELLARQVPSDSKCNVELILVPVTEHNLLAALEKITDSLSSSPPDITLLDHSLSNSPLSIKILDKIMTVSEQILTPVFVDFGPKFFEIGSWTEIDRLPFVPTQLEGAEYGHWKTLRQQPAAGWVIGCAGKLMGRAMHKPEEGFSSSLSETEPLWLSSVWGAAALCASSLAENGRTTLFANHSDTRLGGLPLTDGRNPSPVIPSLNTERIKDFRLAGINTFAFSGDQAFLLGAVSIDGGQANLRFYLSRLIHFLIQLSAEKRKDFTDLEPQLTEAVSLFLQQQGYPEPYDLSIKKGEPSTDSVLLEISITPGPEILPGNTPISFSFNW
ncbi:type VI secretion system contractile sheath domain-containing protein [Maridesulfovibrio sp.]|uniref:type VI secretion system contractile sheath domain-containing protein n=1 Tax=Maridesulfovibrio sp. TaxID=2795000 RepID=UPI0039F05CEB